MDRNPKKKNKSKDNINAYAKYSGIVIQMAAIIAAGSLGGYKIDEIYQFEIPLFTIILSLLAVFIALYVVIKQVINTKDEE